MGEKRNVYRILVGKPEGKRPLGGPNIANIVTCQTLGEMPTPSRARYIAL
jgi:hypothetical protein